MKIKVVRLDNAFGADLATQFGYMKRRPNCIESYGAVSDGLIRAGVVYGSCPAPTSALICGDDNVHDVYCINALWIKPNVNRRVLVDLLVESLKRVERSIVIAYLDPEQVITMSCLKDAGFLYLGMTDSQNDRAYEPTKVKTLFGMVDVKPQKHNISAWYDKEHTVVKQRQRKHRLCYLRKPELYDELVYYPEDDWPV